MTTHEGLQIHLLARVGDSEVLNEIATIEQVLEVEPITDENRTDADSATATARIQVDMAAALRACADEIDAQQGVTREPITEQVTPLRLAQVQVNRLAQYLYEEISAQPNIRLDMMMSGKPEMVDALTDALARIGIQTATDESAEATR